MMDAVTEFHFLRPFWLIVISLPLVIGGLLLLQKNTQQQWSDIVAPHLLPFLVDKKETHRTTYLYIALMVVWVLACIALAGPTWNKTAQPLIKQAPAVVYLWDQSPSMRAEDLTPSRSARSKFKLIDALERNKSGLTGFVAYAGDAHIVTPLTDDVRTIKNLLNSLSPDIMPIAGSNPEMALELAINLLKESNVQSGTIVFVTDGIDNKAHRKLKKLASETQHNFVVWGFGTTQGAPIPQPGSGGFIKDRRSGNLVISKRDDNELSDAAISLKGVYVPFTNTGNDVANVSQLINQDSQAETEETERTFDTWQDNGFYIVLLLLPFCALAFRRGWLLSFTCVFLMLPNEQAHAVKFGDLFLNDEQKAKKLFDEKNYEQAKQSFTNPAWKAHSAYKNKEYESALEIIDQALTDDLESTEQLKKLAFNHGNTLTQNGQYDKAIARYEHALEIDPTFEAAKKNKAIAEKLKELEEQRAENQDQKNENSDKGDNQEPQENDNKGDSSDQNSDQSQEGDKQESEDSKNQSGESSEDQSKSGSNKPSDDEPQDADAQGEQTDEQKEAEQSALEQTYGKQSEEQHQQNTEQEQDQAQKQEDKNHTDDQSEEQKHAAATTVQMTDAEKEAQQSLQQWLRKVPDDPSQLMRNKFNSKSRQRQIENDPLFFTEDDALKRL